MLTCRQLLGKLATSGAGAWAPAAAAAPVAVRTFAEYKQTPSGRPASVSGTPKNRAEDAVEFAAAGEFEQHFVIASK
jgi:hypothetical protein